MTVPVQSAQPNKREAVLTTSHPALRLARNPYLLALVAAGLVALPRLVNLAAFIEGDEAYYWQFANDFYAAVLNRDWRATAIGFGHPAVTMMWLGALGRFVAWLVSGQADPASVIMAFDFSHLAEYRLPIVLANIALTLGIFELARRLLGNRIAWAALILMALEPLYLIDARSMRAEALSSGFIMVALLSFLLFLDRGHRRYWLLSAVLLGLALLSKLSALFLVGYAGLVLGLYLLARPIGWAERARRLLFIYGPWVLMAAFLFWALWPVMWVSPADGLDLSFGLTFRGAGRYRHMYFLGQILYSEPLIYTFYAVVYLLRATPPALVGVAAALVFLAKPLFKQLAGINILNVIRRGYTGPAYLAPRQIWVLAILGFGLLFGLALSIGGHKYERYLMPSLLAFDIVAGAGLYWLAQWVWSRWLQIRLQWPAAAAGGVGLAGLLVVQGVFVLPYHPHYYMYANPLLGGPKTAYNNLEMYSMFALDRVAQYFNALPNPGSKAVAAVNSKEFRPMLKGRWLPLDNLGEWSQADYIVIHIYHLQQQNINPALLAYLRRQEPVHVVEMAGLPFAWIYKGPAVQYFAGPSRLAGKANLLGYNLPAKTAAAGDALPVHLIWENDGMRPEDDLFVQLVDAGGTVWAEAIARPRAGFETAALTEDQFVESQAALAVPAGTPPGVYFLQSGVFSRSRQETLGYFTLPEEGRAVTVTRPASPPNPQTLNITRRLRVDLTPELRLLGFDLPGDTLALNEPNPLSLWWQAQTDIGRDYVISLQLLNPAGQEATYWLGRPVFSGYPTTNWQNGEVVHDRWLLDVPPELSPGPYTLRLSLFDAATQSKAGQVDLAGIPVDTRRRRFDLPEMQTGLNVNLDDGVTLLGYDLFTEPITGGGRLRVTLYWQGRGQVNTAYTVFVHLLDSNGALVAQHDAAPANGAIPTTDWVAKEVVTDRHLVEFPALPSGQYRLVAGMYNPATGERLPTRGGDSAITLQTLEIN